MTGAVVLMRSSKRDPFLALDQRDALDEVMTAAAMHLLHGMSEGAKAPITVNDRKYMLYIVPRPEDYDHQADDAPCLVCRPDGI